MQIHELTRKKKTELEEGWADPVSGGIGKLAGGGVNLARNLGGAIASPFKDVAQGYKSARQDQKVSAMADKAFRSWQNYVAQLEQSIAKQPAPTTAPVTNKDPNNDPPPPPPPAGGAAKADATKDAVAPGAPAPATANATPGITVPPTTAPGTTATPAPITAPATTTAKTPATPNYGAQTGAGATVTYKQPTGVPNPNTPRPTNTKAIGPTTPGVTVTTPAGTTSTPAKTVASTAPGQPITVGKQKIKPGQPGYDQLANATLKELQTPPAPATTPAPVARTALDAFRARTDGKYEAYLTAFVQKNLLAGLGFKGLVNQQEITNDIKEISKPENNDPAKQRPLWNDLVRNAALAVPAAGALTGRDASGAKTTGAPGTAAPGEDPTAQAEPAKPTMTKDQISQWISRNSEDPAALKAALDAINAVKV
jgi:hypothetical protein